MGGRITSHISNVGIG